MEKHDVSNYSNFNKYLIFHDLLLRFVKMYTVEYIFNYVLKHVIFNTIISSPELP